MTDATEQDAPWDGDVNEHVVEEWTNDTTTAERVRQVVDVTAEPQSASEIAERARVSEPTARKHLRAMADAGRAKAVSTDAGTRFVRSPQILATNRIAAIHREYSKTELREAIADLKEELAELRAAHDVSTVDELTVALDAGADGWADVRRWEELEENLEIAEAALTLYDFDPDDSRTAAAAVEDGRRSRGTRRGSFADESSESAA